MLETTQLRHREDFEPGPGSDVFDHCTTGGLVTVNHGLHTEQLPVGNMTVGEIRARYADRFDIDPLSQGQIDGRNVADSTVVQPGQMLMFVRYAGEKGTGA
jgi:hypothetical protein